MNLFFYFFVFTGCWSNITSSIKKQESYNLLQLKTLDGKSFSFSEIKNNKASVFIFLSPECPLCLSYTLTLKNLYTKYDSLNIKFYGVFPGKYYNKRSIKKYVKKYGMKFTMLLDPEYTFTKKLGATITPEVFVLNENERNLYSGKIDNWAYELGKKRTVITEFYLQDAIDSILEGKEISVKKTDAIGCFIFALQKENFQK